MPRQGRDLEQLVETLERLLGGTGTVVKSPDRILGADTKTWREIDVSVRGTVGSSPVLVILECRDRTKPGDLEWIEQLCTKRDSVGADHAVAVAGQFTEPARACAAANGIDIRTLEEVDTSAVASWFVPKAMHLIEYCVDIKAATFSIASSWPQPAGWTLPAAVQELREGTAHLESCVNGRRATLNDVWAAVPRETAYAGLIIGGQEVTRTVRVRYPKADDRYHLIGRLGAAPVEAVTMTVGLWIRVKEIPISRVNVYKRGDDRLAESVTFEIEHAGVPVALELHRDVKSGAGSVTVRRAPPP